MVQEQWIVIFISARSVLNEIAVIFRDAVEGRGPWMRPAPPAPGQGFNYDPQKTRVSVQGACQSMTRK
jgi:hypothetical protein